jgi:tetratricopeptide (TPR) repeat protein
MLPISKVLIPILFLTVLGAVAGMGQVAPHPDAALDQLSLRAQEAQSRGDYRSAAESYREILKLWPNLAEAHANLGLMHHLLGEYSEAIRYFDDALRMKPQLFAPNLFLGLDLLRLQQPRRALTYLQRAQQLNPREEQVTLGLAQAYAALREFPKANQWYFHATEVNPKNADAWYGLGVTYLNLQQAAVEKLGNAGRNSVYFRLLLAESLEQQGRMREAIAQYRQLLDWHPAQPCLHATLGFAYLKQGDLAAAEGELLAEPKGSPGCLLAWLGLARLSYERGDIAAALKEMNDAWKADRSFVEANVPQFWLGFNPEKLDELERQLKQRTASEPEPTLTQFLLNALSRWRQEPVESFSWNTEPSTHTTSRSDSPLDSSQEASLKHRTNPVRLWSQGHYTDCRERLKPELAQLSPAGLLLLAQCAYYSGDYRLSLLASGEALKTSPEDLPGLYWRAKASQKLAVSALMKAGLAEPNSHRVHLLLAQTYLERHDFKQAEAEYGKAIQLKPDDLAAHLGLATTYYHVFQLDKVLPELEKVLRINPKDPEACYLMGEILVNQHQYTEALPYLKSALNSGTSTALKVHPLLGKVYASQGRDVEAVAELEQSLAADRNGSIHYQLYQLYKKLGDEKAAATALQKSEVLRKNQRDSQRTEFSLFSP